MTSPLLTRTEIIRAIRIRKLLEQAESEERASYAASPAAAAYRAKALTLARTHPRGRSIIYNGKPLLGESRD